MTRIASSVAEGPSRPIAAASRTSPQSIGLSDLPALLATLFKLRIGVAIALSGLGGLVLAAQGWPVPLDLVIFLLALLIAAGGAGAFNHWFDRDMDARMGRTRQRPFASGRLSPSVIWPSLFMVQMLFGSALAAWRFGLLSGLFVLTGALTYALVYTVWLKRRTPLNIVIGGAAGSWAVLAGAAAGGDLLAPPIWALTLVIFLWTPSHFWCLAIAIRDDYRRAGVPMLPVTHGVATAKRWVALNTTILIIASLTLAMLVNHWILWAGALLSSAWLGAKTIAMYRRPEKPIAFSAFRASLVQLGLLLIAVFAAASWP